LHVRSPIHRCDTLGIMFAAGFCSLQAGVMRQVSETRACGWLLQAFFVRALSGATTLRSVDLKPSVAVIRLWPMS
jgi:hypothetical protein